MSKEAVKKLMEATEKDPDLRQQIQKVKSPEEVLAIASGQGYEFNEAELISVMQERKLSLSGMDELSDAQLEAVVGGGLKKDKVTDHPPAKFTGENPTIDFKDGNIKVTEN